MRPPQIFLSMLLIGTFPLVLSPLAAQEVPGFSAEKPSDGVSVPVEGGYLTAYTLQVPVSEVEIEMVPVPGGTFLLGSSEDSEFHVEDEGPQVKIEIGPMWVAKYETTWQQYQLYMSMYEAFKNLQGKGLRMINADNRIDAVTIPTPLYKPTHTYAFGQDPQLPAVTMTPYAAKQYCKWLSKLTGQQYRLPTEAEWEYACRGGATSEFHFGDDLDDLEDYAWYYDNADDLPHPVGEKEPNQFGLHDMHGNVMELVVDGYTEDGYAALAEQQQPLSFLAAIQWPESFDNRVVRGGGFQDDPEQLRASARLASEDEDWKEEDPNIPKSPWWYTNDPAREIGFRIFRSYQPIDDELMAKFWEIDHEDIELDVDMRLTNGKGVLTPVDPKIVEQIEQ